jgi:hypothetical protein
MLVTVQICTIDLHAGPPRPSAVESREAFSRPVALSRLPRGPSQADRAADRNPAWQGRGDARRTWLTAVRSQAADDGGSHMGQDRGTHPRSRGIDIALEGAGAVWQRAASASGSRRAMDLAGSARSDGAATSERRYRNRYKNFVGVVGIEAVSAAPTDREDQRTTDGERDPARTTGGPSWTRTVASLAIARGGGPGRRPRAGQGARGGAADARCDPGGMAAARAR